MKVKRVILSTNNHIHYVNYWPIVAHAWKRYGYIPTLFFIGSKKEFPFPDIPGTKVYFVPTVRGLSTVQHARMIRMYAACLFTNDICMISDIDLIPVNPNYFRKMLKRIPDNAFVSLTSTIYPKQLWRCAMSYYVAKGKTFQEILDVNLGKRSYAGNMAVFNQRIKFLDKLKWFKKTDEYTFCILLYDWRKKGSNKKRLFKFARCAPNSFNKPIEIRLPTRFQAGVWRLDHVRLKNGGYIDVIVKPPIQKFYRTIKPFLDLIEYDMVANPITSFGKIIKSPPGSPLKYRKVTPQLIKLVRCTMKGRKIK
jgi:hypothetical protein